MQTKRRRTALLLVATVLTVGALSAKPKGALVTRVNGKSIQVKKSVKADWVSVKRGDWLPIGSELRTGAKSAVVLVYKRLEFRMGPKSRLKIKSLVERGKSRLHLSSGAAWFHLKKKSGQKLQVSTPTMLASVRGTKFSLIEKREATYACVCEGKINARNAKSGKSALKTGDSLHLDHKTGKPELLDYTKYFTKRLVDPEFLKRPEAPAMQYCLSCHKVKTATDDEDDEFDDY